MHLKHGVMIVVAMLTLWIGAVASAATSGLPDLILWGESCSPRITTMVFSSSACEVGEGCAVAGSRRLLRFNTETRNIGAGDLYLGDPEGNPLFEYASCHNHYHFQGFATYRLVNSAGTVLAAGNKVGFCLEDIEPWSSSANSNPLYTCANQGIQAGWADIYNSTLPCQWIDVTGLPAGVYILEMVIDPNNRLAESNDSNNVVRVSVVMDGPCASAPSNDDFSAAQVISNRMGTVIGSNRCASKEGGEPRHAASNPDRSIWYRWTASYSGQVVMTTDGSSLDTLLAVYRGASLSSLTPVASNDDVDTPLILTSRVTFTAVSNTVYQIAADGYGGAEGGVALNLNPDANDHFTNCLIIDGNTGAITGRNINTTRQTGEPNHAGAPASNSVWFCWTPTNSAPVTFDTLGSSFDTLLAVYTGNAVGTLIPVAGDNDSGSNNTSRVVFNALAGTTYRVAVDGFQGASGIFNLNWRPVIQPHFDSILPLSANTFRLALSGQAGQRYALETSSHLASWAPLTTITNLTGTVEFTDMAPGNITQRFYRAVLVP